jgi:hypothetical protein
VPHNDANFGIGTLGWDRLVGHVDEARTTIDVFVRRLMRVQAIAGRATGFSTIGRLMTADSTPNNTPSHHTMS